MSLIQESWPKLQTKCNIHCESESEFHSVNFESMNLESVNLYIKVVNLRKFMNPAQIHDTTDQERMKKKLINTRQHMISQFTGSLPNQTYIHRAVERELVDQIYDVWNEPDVFGMLLYGWKGSGKRTTLLDVLLHMSLSYDVFVINPQYYWFVMPLDWILWITTFGQIRTDSFYVQIQTKQDYAGLFDEIYPVGLEKDLKNLYTNNQHKCHVSFVSNIDLTLDKSGPEQIRDALLYDAGLYFFNPSHTIVFVFFLFFPKHKV